MTDRPLIIRPLGRGGFFSERDLDRFFFFCPPPELVSLSEDEEGERLRARLLRLRQNNFKKTHLKLNLQFRLSPSFIQVLKLIIGT